MGAYRISRNIEASLVDKITADLATDAWSGIRVIKVFSEAYQGTLPCIVVSLDDVSPEKIEIGNKLHRQVFTVNIRIFALSDGQRNDLKDWLFSKLEDDITYYQYIITSGVVSSKVASGKLVILNWNNNRKELSNTTDLIAADRYRQILSFNCYVAN